MMPGYLTPKEEELLLLMYKYFKKDFSYDNNQHVIRILRVIIVLGFGMLTKLQRSEVLDSCLEAVSQFGDSVFEDAEDFKEFLREKQEEGQ